MIGNDMLFALDSLQVSTLKEYKEVTKLWFLKKRTIVLPKYEPEGGSVTPNKVEIRVAYSKPCNISLIFIRSLGYDLPGLFGFVGGIINAATKVEEHGFIVRAEGDLTKKQDLLQNDCVTYLIDKICGFSLPSLSRQAFEDIGAAMQNTVEQYMANYDDIDDDIFDDDAEFHVYDMT